MKKPCRPSEKRYNARRLQRRKPYRFSMCSVATLETLGRIAETLEAYRWIRREDPAYRDVAAAHSAVEYATHMVAIELARCSTIVGWRGPSILARFTPHFQVVPTTKKFP